MTDYLTNSAAISSGPMVRLLLNFFMVDCVSSRVIGMKQNQPFRKTNHGQKTLFYIVIYTWV